jgi:hypothetical protein
MHSSRILTAALTVAALSTSTAAAATPWSAPATVPGALSFGGQLAVTNAGHAELAIATAGSNPNDESFTQVNSISTTGQPGAAHRVGNMSFGRIAAYASDHIILVGQQEAATAAQAKSAPVLVATGTPESGVGTPKALSGTADQTVDAVAGNTAGTAAFVTAQDSGHRQRIVWVRANGATKRVLTISVSAEAGAAAVSVGSKGDVLVVWQDKDKVFSQHIGPTGHAASAHTLGSGVEGNLQALYDASGRQEVAWLSQRVGEGDAESPATISYTSAASGHNFTKAKVIGQSSITGTGRYVASPGVRLVASGTDSSVLAMTVYDGANFRVQVATVAAGSVQTPQSVSPAGQDNILGDLAYARTGGTLVLWTTNTRGADPVGAQSIVATTRPTGQTAFTAPQQVTGPQTPYGTSAVVNAVTGSALAEVGYLTDTATVSSLASLS